MPSGSHGGSHGGSHSSGGASWGGSSRGSSSGGMHGGGGHYSPRRPMRFHWGRSIWVMPGEKVSTLGTYVLVFFVLGLFLFGLGFFVSTSYKDLEVIKVDRAYYLDMIEYAENNPEYMKKGTITDWFYNDSANKWYFTYQIPYSAGYKDSEGNANLEGYTYSVYDFDDRASYRIGTEQSFAVNNKTVTETTDSINIDYKNIPLEDDGEYKSVKKQIALGWIFESIFALAEVGMIFAIINHIRKSFVKEVDGSLDEDNQYANCPYCGSVLNDDENKCKNCGATLKKRKRKPEVAQDTMVYDMNNPNAMNNPNTMNNPNAMNNPNVMDANNSGFGANTTNVGTTVSNGTNTTNTTTNTNEKIEE